MLWCLSVKRTVQIKCVMSQSQITYWRKLLHTSITYMLNDTFLVHTIFEGNNAN